MADITVGTTDLALAALTVLVNNGNNDILRGQHDLSHAIDREGDVVVATVNAGTTATTNLLFQAQLQAASLASAQQLQASSLASVATLQAQQLAYEGLKTTEDFSHRQDLANAVALVDSAKNALVTQNLVNTTNAASIVAAEKNTSEILKQMAANRSDEIQRELTQLQFDASCHKHCQESENRVTQRLSQLILGNGNVTTSPLTNNNVNV